MKFDSIYLVCALWVCFACVQEVSWAGGKNRAKEENARSETVSESKLNAIPVGTQASEAAAYVELQKSFASRNPNNTLEEFQQKALAFSKRYSKSALNPQVKNLQGLAYLFTKHPLQAANQFKKSIELSQQAAFRLYVSYNLATAQYEMGNFDEAQATLASMKSDDLALETRIKYHLLKSRVLLKQQNPVFALVELLESSKNLELDAGARALYVQQIEQSLPLLLDLERVEKIYQQQESSPFVDLVLFRLGSQEFSLGKMAQGEKHIKKLLADFPQSLHAADARDLLKTLVVTAPVDSKVIGVLLPMKGRYAHFSQQCLQGIEMALGIFSAPGVNSNSRSLGYQLVIEDSGEEVDTTVAALTRLVQDHHVIAVIGPLLSKGIDAVATKADQLGVPLLSLSQQMPAAPSESFVAAGLTLRLQAYEVARHAIQVKGLKRFAIVYSRDKYGEAASQAFWDAVEQLGGTIQGVESYVPGETDYRQVVDRLAGLFYTESRHRELEDLMKYRELNNIKKRNRKTEQYFSLKSLHDFDAVFVPGEPKESGQLIPTFTYRDVDGVKFLGLSNWNQPEFLQRGQNFVEGAIFTDGFFIDSDSLSVQHFVEQYQAIFSQQPKTQEVMSYDAAIALASVLGSSDSRSEVIEKLKKLNGVQGVLGRMSWRDGQLFRPLPILTVQAQKMVEVR